MREFDHLLNWKLKRGSHPFPGLDGGTCINEAALVAAGFTYRSISSAAQMPECFSRPICTYAMWLNDCATDEDRQRLLPYVTRLACADSPEIENQRAAYIARHTRTLWFIHSMDAALRVLDGALAIGQQAIPFPEHEVRSRLEAVKVEAAAIEPAPASPLFSKVKSWFSIKEPEAGT